MTDEHRVDDFPTNSMPPGDVSGPMCGGEGEGEGEGWRRTTEGQGGLRKHDGGLRGTFPTIAAPAHHQ